MIDLHVHSHFSDGSDSPAEVIDLAAKAGCTAIALTDHDTLAGIQQAQTRADELGIELVVGIELSAHTSQRNVHILGYFIDHTSSVFDERLIRQQSMRLERNQRLVERFSELSITISMEDVREIAGTENVGRPHFAAALVRNGHASSINDAFARYLAQGADAYVERQELPAREAIEWIAEAGGVASWAHPEWRGMNHDNIPELESVLEELVDSGLTGLEARYSRYDGDKRQRLVRMAKRYGLVATGGSDYHGTYKPDLSVGVGLGDLNVAAETLEELRSRL